jgi:Arc/MetJ-type ribon-helix-helix transcriptional regulator
MSTLSIPVTAEQEAFINAYIKAGNADNKAQVVRRALNRFAEDEAVNAVLQAEKEPTLYGDLRELAKKIK